MKETRKQFQQALNNRKKNELQTRREKCLHFYFMSGNKSHNNLFPTILCVAMFWRNEKNISTLYLQEKI